jgi:methionyl-tRNA formyltransferase
MNIFNTIKSGDELDSIPQNEKDASYSLWRDDLDYQIDWSKSANSIKRFIDSVGYPYKGAITKLENKLVVILESTVMENVKIENRMVGKLIYYNNDKPVIVCGDGLIRLDEVVYQDSRESILPLKKFRTRFL